MLQKEFDYFIQNQNDLVRRYGGKVIVIKDQKVIGTYDTEWEAYVATVKEHELGTFLIQACRPGPEAYTAILHPIISPA